MPATTRAARHLRTMLPTPRRFLHCIACGTIKKERSYALCSECYKLNGTLDRGLFTHLAQRVERESVQYSYRRHPEFEQACRIYAQRRQRARAAAAFDVEMPRYQPRDTDARNRYQHEQYDGLGGHDLGDLLDWQMYGIDLPQPERSEHREMSDAEIARWDAHVDAWAKARGVRLTDEPAPDLQPWGFWMEIAGAMVWTDDIV